MTKSSNTTAIEEKTGKKWFEWLELLESFGAKDLTHTEITKKLHEATAANGWLASRSFNEGWWIQAVTVAYEQHIGRRVPGQRADGTFEVSVNKTVSGSMDEVFARWLELTDKFHTFNGVTIAGEAGSSETEKWRNWRCNLADGTKVVVGINQKTPEKAMLGLAHQKLPTAQIVEGWREFWHSFLDQL